MTLTAEQIRAARALLNWSQDDLAQAVGVSTRTIERLEAGRASRPINFRGVRSAFVDAGVEFFDDGGLRLRPQKQAS